MTKEAVVAAIDKRHPRSFDSLQQFLKSQGTIFSRKQLAAIVDELRAQGLTSMVSTPSISLFQFLTSIKHSWWVYVGAGVPVTETALVESGSTTGAAVVLRLVLGLGILGFIPGYLTMRVLFSREAMPKLEEVLVSVFLSLIIAIGAAIALGIGAFFNPENVSLTLSGYSLMTVLGASYRTLRSTPKV